MSRNRCHSLALLPNRKKANETNYWIGLKLKYQQMDNFLFSTNETNYWIEILRLQFVFLCIISRNRKAKPNYPQKMKMEKV